MKTRNLLLSLIIGFAIIGLSMPSSNVQGKPTSIIQKEIYTGNMFYFDGTFGPFGRGGGNRSGSGAEFFTMTVDSYTPANEVTDILDALKQSGQDGLLKKLSKSKRGTIRFGSNIARDIQAIWITQTEEGRKISALSERWLGFGELRRGARSVDYPLTYIEIFIEEDGGKSEGSLIPAARVRSKGGNNIEIENFGIYPARLTNIKLGKK